MIKIGNKNASNFMIGNKQVDKIYSGKTLIWPDTPTVERWYLYDGKGTGVSGTGNGFASGYNSYITRQEYYQGYFTINNTQMSFWSGGNKTATFSTIIKNKGYTKMGIKCEVPSGNSGNYNVSRLIVGTGLDTSKITEYGAGITGAKITQFYTFYGSSDRETYPWTFAKKIVETDISALGGQDFYLQLHNCACDWYVYSIYFE